MNIFFSGGTGFFGKAVLRYLTALDGRAREALVSQMTVLSRDPDRFLGQHPEFAALPWLTFHRGDIEAPESLPRDGDFTHVLHAAADSTNVGHLDPWRRHEQITLGTKNMLQFAADRGIRRFLLTSSGGVYGAQPADLDTIPETYHGMPDPLHAANAYGVAKRQAEHLCALYADRYGIEPVVARCFAFVGEDLPLDVHFAIGNFIRDALFRDEIVINGDGSPVRSYMDQAELARWLLAILRNGMAGRAYNVGGHEPVTLLEAARLVSRVLGNDKPVRVLHRAGGDNPIRNRYLPDLSRAESELRLVNEIDLADALRRAGHGIRSRIGAGRAY
ncbi:NAD-dependent epimerase/dehydratase family protein [Burkholderia vietnamiensis]|uniref:NAD-dependent epimerase/dehydratase family protein n=1 Tax=Burkholderia vietnamiensis TaxID=60552 RepID=UPI00075DEFDE|nr:NAD(P)-dependent oxidoreductase [Burkholderia vietnamiensis]KVE55623.1 UDP-glucose 4-epimerase [Burkholderia vietnamiensis]KVE79822.1 UDP-glucose 4-epimerase [Burkholderia vietnamiensis]KVR76886.1 UDP-glucose 4-epimerase [Burkholderia vietnamiensis]KVS33996.1 UDP-glucose 4-epimerase [Burkholderia vietnamiensis]MBR8148703.1 NAD(P)-dependent oxidoreductase [Burkholderia vietnamiensis]